LFIIVLFVSVNLITEKGILILFLILFSPGGRDPYLYWWVAFYI